MSSTRTATKPGPLRQERFASSRVLTRGLLGNLVARRCSALSSRTARERIYFLHDLSHREPHLRHPSCTSFAAWPWPASVEQAESAFERVARELCEFYPERVKGKIQAKIPDFLTRLCLDPKTPAESAELLGFRDILGTLDEYQRRFHTAIASRVAQTATTREVWALLDYAHAQRGLVLGEGPYRTGKSFSAQAWAQMHLGQCRYVQLSSSKDENAFYRDIARGVGVACSAKLKCADMRNRIEAVFREQHLLLIIDEADWIWPQAVCVKEAPHRVNWLLTSLVNQGVPVALLGSRNFSRMMLNTERRCPVWGSEQFHGRLKLRKPLPETLCESDLFAIAAAVLAEAAPAIRMLLVGHALKCAAPVAAIEAAASRARYFAAEAGHALDFADMERVLIEAGTLAAPPAREPSAQPSRILRETAFSLV